MPQPCPTHDACFISAGLQAGGQRLVQVLVYLNTLGEEQGGGTHFCHPLLQGLTVQVGRAALHMGPGASVGAC